MMASEKPKRRPQLKKRQQQNNADRKYVRKHRHERGRHLEEFIAEMKKNGGL